MIYKIFLKFKIAYVNFFKIFGFIPIIKDIRKSKGRKDIKFFKTSTGKYYLPKYYYQDIIRNHIIKNLVYDKEIYNCSKNFIKENSIVLDLGANYGQMSVLMGSFKKNVTVYSFEANKYVFNLLKKNLEVNNIKNKCFNVAITDDLNKKYNFENLNKEKFETLGSYNLSEIKNFDNQSEYIKSMKIDDLSFDKKISFMKVDIQGMDLQGMKSAKKTIYKHKMPIIFEYENLFEEELSYNFQYYVNFVDEINYTFTKVIGCNNFLITPK